MKWLEEKRMQVKRGNMDGTPVNKVVCVYSAVYSAYTVCQWAHNTVQMYSVCFTHQTHEYLVHLWSTYEPRP